MNVPTPKPVLVPGVLYQAHDVIVCDRVVCAGSSALYTGVTACRDTVVPMGAQALFLEIASRAARGNQDPLTCECGALTATITNGTVSVSATPLPPATAGDDRNPTTRGEGAGGPAVAVTELTLDDAAQDLRLILDGSEGDVDGITASAQPHPAHDPAGAAPGHTELLVTFTDSTGRNRIADVEIRVRGWREDGCWHLHTSDGAHGTECAECGTPVDTPPQHHARLALPCPTPRPTPERGSRQARRVSWRSKSTPEIATDNASAPAT